MNQPPFLVVPAIGATESDVDDEAKGLVIQSGTRACACRMPDLATLNSSDQAAVLAFLDTLIAGCESLVAEQESPHRFPMTGLPGSAHSALTDLLGEGGILYRIAGITVLQARETNLAGIWRLVAENSEWIEICCIPQIVDKKAFIAVRPALGPLAFVGIEASAASALFSDLFAKARAYRPGIPPYHINLLDPPQTSEDLNNLDSALGSGAVSITVNREGTWRIEATGMVHVWRVTRHDPAGKLVTDRFEVGDIPALGKGPESDFAETSARLRELREAVSTP